MVLISLVGLPLGLLGGCFNLPEPGPDAGSGSGIGIVPGSVPTPEPGTETPAAVPVAGPLAKQTLDPSQPTAPTPELLQESWLAYRQRFIQIDGRVIDWQAASRSTSESQAYAMLRAVMVDDRETFERTLNWAEANLARRTDGFTDAPLTDQLWAWDWGQQGEKWGIVDQNFASDGDIDAVTALILASRRWNRPDYLSLAQAKLKDIWDLSTVTVGEQRYLLPGPALAFDKGDRIQLNPSYLAPYAFRLFATVDPSRDWLSLVPSSYQVLEESSNLSSLGLPSDWVELSRADGRFRPVASPSALKSQYGFDAYRVWWRVAIDLAKYNAPEARQYLTTHLQEFQRIWEQDQRIVAQYGLDGSPLADYEATSQYGMLYAAFREIDPQIAAELFQFKLLPRYNAGIWDDESAYYSQNLAWLGLFPFEDLTEVWP